MKKIVLMMAFFTTFSYAAVDNLTHSVRDGVSSLQNANLEVVELEKITNRLNQEDSAEGGLKQLNGYYLSKYSPDLRKIVFAESSDNLESRSIQIDPYSFNCCLNLAKFILAQNRVSDVVVSRAIYFTGIKELILPIAMQIIDEGAIQRMGLQRVKITYYE